MNEKTLVACDELLEKALGGSEPTYSSENSDCQQLLANCLEKLASIEVHDREDGSESERIKSNKGTSTLGGCKESLLGNGRSDFDAKLIGMLRKVVSFMALPSKSLFCSKTGNVDMEVANGGGDYTRHASCIELMFKIMALIVQHVSFGELCEEREGEGGSRGLPLIEEVSDEVEVMLVDVLLVCGLYGVDKGIDLMPWTSESASGCSNDLIEQLARQWHALKGARYQAEEGSGIGNDVLVQALIVRCIREIRSELGGVLMVKRKDKSGASKLWDDAFTRTIAAQKFAWLVLQVNESSIDQGFVDSVVPCMCSMIDNPFASLKMYGLAILDHLLSNSQRPWLLQWKEVLLNVIWLALPGSSLDARILARLFPLACSLVIKVEGSDPRQPGYGILMSCMLKEMCRSSLDKQKRLVFMKSIQPVIKAMGIMLIKHFSSLLPLILGFMSSLDSETRLVAVETLALIIKHTWPRIPAHANVLWGVLLDAYRLDAREQHSLDVQKAMNECAKLLTKCSPDVANACVVSRKDSLVKSDCGGLVEIVQDTLKS